MQDEVRTLETPDMDKEMARKEFLESPIYRKLLMSPDGKTTALLVYYKRDEKYFNLLQKRNDLRDKKWESGLNKDELKELEKASREFKEYLAYYFDYQGKEIESIRRIMDKYRE